MFFLLNLLAGELNLYLYLYLYYTHFIFWPGNWSHSLFLFLAQLGSPSFVIRFLWQRKFYLEFILNLIVWVASFSIMAKTIYLEFILISKLGLRQPSFCICWVLFPNIHNSTIIFAKKSSRIDNISRNTFLQKPLYSFFKRRVLNINHNMQPYNCEGQRLRKSLQQPCWDLMSCL